MPIKSLLVLKSQCSD